MLVGEVFARMGVDSKQYEKDLSRLEGVTRREATTLGSIFKNAFSVALGMGVFEAIKRGFQTIASTAISFNAQMEQARIGFTTMLGSAEVADAFLRELYDFAVRTPFEFPELLDASKRMLAYGFAAKDVIPTLEAVGNASAAVGLGTEGINRIILALGQMRAKGKVTGEEMRQLTETGIPAWEMLAEAMGFSADEVGRVMDMASKGLIPADRAIKMLIEGMNKRFPDMMKNMENTWEGITSTIKDIWQMTIGTLTSGLFEGLKTWLQGVRDWAADFNDTFQKYGLQRAISESFGPEVAALVSVLGAVMRGLASVVKAVTGFFVQYGKQIKFVAIVMGTYLALTRAVTLAKQIMIAVTAVERGQLLAKIPVLNVVSAAMGIYRVQMALAAQQGVVLTGVIAKLRVALFSLWSALGPIGWIILGLSAAVGVGTHLWGKYTKSLQKTASVGFGDFREAERKLADGANDSSDALGDQADALDKAGKAANKNLQSFDEVHQLQEDMAGSAGDLAESMGFDDTVLGAPEAGGLEIPDIGAQLEEMKPTLAGFWEWIKQGAGNLWEKVKEKWNGFWNWVKGWGIWTTLKEKWNGLKEGAGNLWEGVKEKWAGFKEWAGDMWEGVKQKWSDFVNWVKSWAVWDWLAKKWSGLKNIASTAWNGVAKVISSTWDNIKETASDIWGAIWDFLSNQWNAIKELGSSIFGALRDLILGKIDLRTAVSRIWEAIKTFFANTWTNIKNLGIGIWTAIGNFFKDQWELTKQLVNTIWTAIKDFFVNNWKATKEAAKNIWNAIKTFFSDIWGAIKTAATNIWTAIRDFLGINWEETKKRASEIWGNIKTIITDKWEELKNAVGPTWNRIKTAIADKWREIKDDAFNWGKNLISSFVEGIKNKINSVKSTLKSVGETVKDFLGFSSPTKEGPGRFADEWAPNLMNMFAEGLNQNIPKVRSAVDEVVQQLTGMTVQPTVQQSVVPATTTVVSLEDSGFINAIASAVGTAVMNAMQFTGTGNVQSGDMVLNIDSREIARATLDSLNKEAIRLGYKPLLQT